MGHGPVEGLFYGSQMPARKQSKNEGTTIGGIWIPDMSTSVAEVFERNAWPFKWLNAEGINSSESIDALRDSGATLAIFAGKGGEIVSSRTLAQGVPLLHMHPGRLPEQRGSTTIYYSILEGKECAVSAIIMDKEIDAGPLLAIKTYAIPGPDIDVDVEFDCAIRADTMIKVIQYLRENGELPSAQISNESAGRLYYVVHPLLKHLALLSLK
jgi:methionyl-tRNA formyltransferase